MELPKNLKSGEVARLIPVVADSRKEQRAASTFLAVLSVVPDFANVLFHSIGHRIGRRARVNTYTEVVFQQDQSSSDRPDGFIEIKSGKQTWSALVEVKIGTSSLRQEQIERYLSLARNNKVDAVITISNQFAARPDHSPVAVSKTSTRKVQLFHFSWSAIFTEALLLQENAVISDPDKAFILREFIRFISHDSVGVNGYQTMPKGWKPVIESLQANASLKRTDPSVEEVVWGWHQEIRDLALILTRELGQSIEVKLDRSHLTDPVKRLKDDIAVLSETNVLSADLAIPNAASDLNVTADLRARAVRVGMTVDAPGDKKRTSARINWLLRQLKDADAENLFVKIFWPRRSKTAVFPLATLREEPNAVEEANSKTPPKAFEVFMTSESARRFMGRRTVIEDIENVVPSFYEMVGQHLEQWHPKPPKPKKHLPEEKVQEPSPEPDQAKPKAGNESTALLEIPSFLKRW